ncbi:MAG TPA: type II secretion system F family protein [Dehalococcoidia bacterium]|nr:type II secretion system F family protein [Dehalococcoidia bacterium]
MDIILLLVALTLAGSVGLFAFVGQQALVARRHNMSPRSGSGSAATNQGISPVSLLRRQQSRIPFSKLLPLSRESEERMNRELERAGWPLRVSEYLSLRAATAAAGGLTGLLLMVSQPVPGWLKLPLILAAVLAGWLLPRLLLSRARRKRLATIENQLPDALLAMAKSLQVGAGLMQALSNTAEQTPAPLGREMERTLRDLHLGAEAEDVFGALAERVGSGDVDIMVAAIVIQRTTGGNLSEVLLNVASTIRERAEIRGEILTLTASQRLSANMVALMPVLVAAAFIFLQPDYGDLLLHTLPGQISLAIAIGFELSGYWLIRRLGVIEV